MIGKKIDSQLGGAAPSAVSRGIASGLGWDESFTFGSGSGSSTGGFSLNGSNSSGGAGGVITTLLNDALSAYQSHEAADSQANAYKYSGLLAGIPGLFGFGSTAPITQAQALQSQQQRTTTLILLGIAAVVVFLLLRK